MSSKGNTVVLVKRGVVSDSVVRVGASLLATLSWAAVLAQCYWGARASLEKGTPVCIGVLNVLSYFTILTNIVVAIVFTARVVHRRGREPVFLLKPATQTAVATYIVIVGCVYEVALRRLWSPSGLHLAADFILHYIVPIGYLLYWLLAVPKGTLRYAIVWSWTIYPFGYLLYSIARGVINGFFPYPFVNFAELGFSRFAANVAGLILVFICTGLVFIALDRAISTQRFTRSAPGAEKSVS